MKCSLDTCMEREGRRKARYAPSGIYKGAKEEGATVPGVNVPYEEPVSPEVVVDSEKMSVEACAEKVEEFIMKQAWCEEERQ